MTPVYNGDVCSVKDMVGISLVLWYKHIFQERKQCQKYAMYAEKGRASASRSATHIRLPRKNGSQTCNTSKRKPRQAQRRFGCAHGACVRAKWQRLSSLYTRFTEKISLILAIFSIMFSRCSTSRMWIVSRTCAFLSGNVTTSAFVIFPFC